MTKSTDDKNSTKENVEVKKEPTMSEKIWADIKDRQIEIFGLPNQTVSQWCSLAYVEPSKLYVIPKVGAVIQSLLERVGAKYDVELADKYLVVSLKKTQ